jgi:glycosyltransferase involved in cell wall biosynthesis
MKIGIDCRLINKHQNTGISRYTEFLIEYYKQKVGSKNITLITNDCSFSSSEFEIIYTRLLPYNLFHFFFFPALIYKLKINLFHSPFYSGFYKKNKVISIITVHDLMYRLVSNFFGTNYLLNSLKIFYFDYIVKKSLSNADFVISVSKTTKADLFKAFGYSSVHIPEDCGINFNDKEIDKEILQRFNLKPKQFFFYCGNNRPHKNVSFMKKVFYNNPDLSPLVLAGKGHKNCKNVISVGVITENELKSLYKSSIAFIFPSHYEGFGLPIIEALNFKTIVLASRIPAFLEFKSKNIFYFDNKNEVELLKLLHEANNYSYVEDDFMNGFKKEYIYNKYDSLLNFIH